MSEAPATIPEVAYIGIGSNLDDPARHVRDAITELHELPESHCEAVSSLYANPPMGPSDQPDYVNAVVGLSTQLQPQQLLAQLQAMENRHGRERTNEQWGPRTLDLDIILYGLREIDEPDLRIPHPGAHERAFVLIPLFEINDAGEIPGKGRVRDLVRNVQEGQIHRLDSQP